jgi:endonuclease/exonuclease/phosphatase family metal-dependent hydrolase
MRFRPQLLAVLLFFVVLPFAAGIDIVVAYYNVQNYLPMNRKIGSQIQPNSPKPEQEVAALVSSIKRINPDVLGVAEMGDETMLRDFRERLKAAGMDFQHLEWVRGDDAARHLAMLSKFPIIARNSIDDVAFDLDGKRHRMGRGILDVTVKVSPAYELRLVGLHLKSKRAVPMFDQAKFRASEAMAVRQHLDKILGANPETNLLLFGDLNDTKNEFPVRTILGSKADPASLREIPLKDRHGLAWTHYWDVADIYSRIDFLMASQALWPEINLQKSGIGGGKDWRKASDHRPLYTTISTKE